MTKKRKAGEGERTCKRRKLDDDQLLSDAGFSLNLSVDLPTIQTPQRANSMSPSAPPAAPISAPADNGPTAMDTQQNVPIARYQKYRELKQCYGGAVFHGLDFLHRRHVIIKEIKFGNDLRLRKVIENEIKVHKHLSKQPDCSPHIVQLLDVVWPTPDIVWLVQEAAFGGEALTFLETTTLSGEERTRQVKKYMQQIVEGLTYIHDNDVAHLDISPENIMFDHLGNIKIIDFGISHLCDQSCQGVDHLSERIGKLKYMAPEVYAPNTPYEGRMADAWTLGIIMFMMLTGFPPVDVPDAAYDRRLFKILGGGLADLCSHWKLNLDPDAIDLMQKLLTVAENRISLDDVAAHKFLRG